jgi:aminopeptidase
MDNRIKRLADVLVHYSCNIQKGERVLIAYDGNSAKPLVKQIIKEVYACGGHPYVEIKDSSVTREILLGCSEEQLGFMNEYLLYQMKGMHAYIGVRASDNASEHADVPSSQQSLYGRMLKPTLRQRIDHSKWVVLRYPNYSMAQLANTSLENFEDFYFNVCTLDYGKMDKAMDVLKALMDKTYKVHITGPGTDLTFSIKGIDAVKCSGERNIPDGEIYTAPVKKSMNGIISYNTPSEEEGFTFEEIVFEVKDGKIVKASSNNSDRINQLLDTDEGARYFGEFAIGINPYILQPMKDTLFDEKIAGSFHLTPGCAYEDANNGNVSAVHWDLVMIQRPEYGGGEIYFDDVLVRKDGLFVLPELELLNPENLK